MSATLLPLTLLVHTTQLLSYPWCILCVSDKPTNLYLSIFRVHRISSYVFAPATMVSFVLSNNPSSLMWRTNSRSVPCSRGQCSPFLSPHTYIRKTRIQSHPLCSQFEAQICPWAHNKILNENREFIEIVLVWTFIHYSIFTTQFLIFAWSATSPSSLRVSDSPYLSCGSANLHVSACFIFTLTWVSLCGWWNHHLIFAHIMKHIKYTPLIPKYRQRADFISSCGPKFALFALVRW